MGTCNTPDGRMPDRRQNELTGTRHDEAITLCSQIQHRQRDACQQCRYIRLHCKRRTLPQHSWVHFKQGPFERNVQCRGCPATQQPPGQQGQRQRADRRKTCQRCQWREEGQRRACEGCGQHHANKIGRWVSCDRQCYRTGKGFTQQHERNIAGQPSPDQHLQRRIVQRLIRRIAQHRHRPKHITQAGDKLCMQCRCPIETGQDYQCGHPARLIQTVIVCVSDSQVGGTGQSACWLPSNTRRRSRLSICGASTCTSSRA